MNSVKNKIIELNSYYTTLHSLLKGNAIIDDNMIGKSNIASIIKDNKDVLNIVNEIINSSG